MRHRQRRGGPTLPRPAASAYDVELFKDKDWYGQCMRVQHLRPARQASVPVMPPLRCNARNLYYDTLSQAARTSGAWNQVREWAISNGDDAVLMMLYANGYGVRKDADIAIMHACQLEAAPAETEARVLHLAAGAAAPDARPFDLCTHITSGYMGGVCAGIEGRQNDRIRRARLDDYKRSLSGHAQTAFIALRQAAANFARARSENETDMSGTAAAGFVIMAIDREEEQFLQDVLSFKSGSAPAHTPAQFAAADAQLNRAYRHLVAAQPGQGKTGGKIGDSTVNRSDVRDAERAWIAYRDAWVNFVMATRQSTPESIKTLLSQRRTRQLAELARTTQ